MRWADTFGRRPTTDTDGAGPNTSTLSANIRFCRWVVAAGRFGWRTVTLPCPGDGRGRSANGIPERGGVVNPYFPACLGCGSAAFGQRRARVGSTRSARSEARTNGVEAIRGRRTLSSRRLVPALVASMKLWSASVSMSRSTAARGCQAFLRDDAGRMKPWDVSLWWSGGRGANHLLDRTVVGHAATRPARRFSFHAAAAAAAARAVARHRASPSRRT